MAKSQINLKLQLSKIQIIALEFGFCLLVFIYWFLFGIWYLNYCDLFGIWFLFGICDLNYCDSFP